ncbi:hypothetical protein MCW_01376 [Cardidatus Bartonella washoeensis 085-0475]|uniref:Uncharacterized protein n=1 Tax=Cardidatus Bartonella washoeensis 085-0475 TaxID=1094564 RepID=J1JFK0_9HYPH|nr:hypothetical protein MCW_01376 [Bartonella washoeensis 085-0475]
MGLMDFTSQNKKLETMRSISYGSLKGDEISVFLRAVMVEVIIMLQIFLLLNMAMEPNSIIQHWKQVFCLRKLRVHAVAHSLGLWELMEVSLYILKMLNKAKRAHLINGLLLLMEVCSMTGVFI